MQTNTGVTDTAQVSTVNATRQSPSSAPVSDLPANDVIVSPSLWPVSNANATQSSHSITAATQSADLQSSLQTSPLNASIANGELTMADNRLGGNTLTVASEDGGTPARGSTATQSPPPNPLPASSPSSLPAKAYSDLASLFSSALATAKEISAQPGLTLQAGNRAQADAHGQSVLMAGNAAQFASSQPALNAGNTNVVGVASPQNALSLLVPQSQTNLRPALHNEQFLAPTSASTNAWRSFSPNSTPEKSQSISANTSTNQVGTKSQTGGETNTVPPSRSTTGNSPNKTPAPGANSPADTGQSAHKNPTAETEQAAATIADSPSAAAPSTGSNASLLDPTIAAATPQTGNSSLTAQSSSANPAPAQTSSQVPNQPPASPPAGPVQMAQIVARAAQSEMHIGLNTSAFGSVDVRTVVRANDVGLLVGSEKGDLHTLLANEIPSLSNSLQQQDLRLTQVSFHQGSGLSGNTYSGGDAQQRSYNGAARTPSFMNNEDETAQASAIAESISSANLSSPATGLNILA